MYPFTIANDSTITFHIDGETFAVRKDNPVYEDVLNALKEESWDIIPNLLSKARKIFTDSNGEIKLKDEQLFCHDEDGKEFPLPPELNEEVLKYSNMNLNYDRLIKFARKLQKNPSYRSVNQLFDWVKRGGLTITPEGNFIAYRGVMKINSSNCNSVSSTIRKHAEFTDWHSKTMDNSIGKTVELPRNQVDEDHTRSCSHGLHVATHEYAHSWYTNHAGGNYDNGAVVFVEVCPSDVVAVPVGEPTKMRVSKFKVIGLSKDPIVEPQWDPPNYHDDEDEDDYPNYHDDEDEDEDEDDYPNYHDDEDDGWCY